MNRPSERIVVIGASAGGVAALRLLLAAFDADFGWPVVIVLHIGSGDIGGLIEVLQAVSPLPVVEARAGEAPRAGTVHVAPGGYHLLLEAERSFSLSVDERVCHVRPSADVLFSSAADAYRSGAVGVVLTGTNEDGAQGLADIRIRGGLGFVQDPSDAEEPCMPRAAIAGGTDAILPIEALARRLMTEYHS